VVKRSGQTKTLIN